MKFCDDLLHLHEIADVPAYVKIRARLKPGIHYGTGGLLEPDKRVAVRSSIIQTIDQGLRENRVPAGLNRGIIPLSLEHIKQANRDLLYPLGINPIIRYGAHTALWGSKFIDWDGSIRSMAIEMPQRHLTNIPMLQPLHEFLSRAKVN